ncbi:2-phosphosulfolactate phosphatase [Herbidospora galbida]|uniref:2-phosphosulfolactate phosphatase n=1 Tax=Herbidospora galbida TaxID=2575442 RepID=UPI001BB0865D|nr:2-phosphosulfolactate phosphatase [Herbidospora galbida]
MDPRFLAISELTDTPRVAVVVDVMRAFTLAAWAFARGAEKIALAGSLDEALALKDGPLVLCAGFVVAEACTEDALTVLRRQ